MKVTGTRIVHLIRSLLRWLPASWLVLRWRHGRYWWFRRLAFEYRHYRRLLPLLARLAVLLLIWSLLVAGLALVFGGTDFLRQEGFAQGVVASLLVLPIAIAVGVLIATPLQQHSLRFQARRAGDEMANSIGHAVFKFILLLSRDCGIPIDLKGPVNHRLVDRVRETTLNWFVASEWRGKLPRDFEDRLYAAIDEVSDCFTRAGDLRLAFPRAFDLIDDLRSTVSSIRAGHSSSSPENTALIFLHYATEILRNLE